MTVELFVMTDFLCQLRRVNVCSTYSLSLEGNTEQKHIRSLVA